MKDLSSDELLVLLELLSDAYKKTSVSFVSGSDHDFVDDKGADLLRLIFVVSSELVKRIELPF